MIVALVLLLLGLIAVYLEFYVPGGVLAVIGTLCIFAAIWSFVATYPSPLAVTAFVAVTIGGLIAVIRLALWRIRKSAATNTFFLKTDQEGYIASTITANLAGKEGVALTDLTPAGYVLIEGEKYPALCKGPYQDKGTTVIVTSQQGAHLVVKPKPK